MRSEVQILSPRPLGIFLLGGVEKGHWGSASITEKTLVLIYSSRGTQGILGFEATKRVEESLVARDDVAIVAGESLSADICSE
jgi:hypothetical protein